MRHRGERLISITTAKVKLHELVSDLPEPVLLLRHGRPVAVLLDVEQYEGLLARIEELEG